MSEKMCGRCYAEVDEVYLANCAEKPEKLAGQPLGQYHCPDCGAMVIAGLPHPELCKVCIERKHPGFDAETPATSTGIGGDCPRCGTENVRLYAWSNSLDFCEKCLKELP